VPGHALELLIAPVLKVDLGTRDSVLDRARHEHPAWLNVRRHACADVDDPTEVAIHGFARAGVQTGTKVDSQRSEVVDDSPRAPRTTAR
jgi:hypothetical protein